MRSLSCSKSLSAAQELVGHQSLRRRGNDAGMVTAETAVVLPVLVLSLALLLAVIGQALDQVKAVDAARSGARLAARGESEPYIREQVLSEAPPGSVVKINHEGAEVRVSVTAPGRQLLGPLALPHVAASVVALVEADLPL